MREAKPQTISSTISATAQVRSGPPVPGVHVTIPASSPSAPSISSPLTTVTAKPRSADSPLAANPAKEPQPQAPTLSRSAPLPAAINRTSRDAPETITLANRVSPAAPPLSDVTTSSDAAAKVPPVNIPAGPIPVPAVLAPDLSSLSLSTEQLIDVHTLADEFIEQIGNADTATAQQPEERATLRRKITQAAQTTEQRYRQLYGDFALAELRRIAYAQLAPPESTP